MGLRARGLAGELGQYVECIWVCSSAPGPWRRERVLPWGRAQMMVKLKEDETRNYGEAGVVFRPGGTLVFLGVPAPLLRERLLVPEEELRRVWAGRALHPAVGYALRKFEAEDDACGVPGGGFVSDAGAGESGLSGNHGGVSICGCWMWIRRMRRHWRRGRGRYLRRRPSRVGTGTRQRWMGTGRLGGLDRLVNEEISVNLVRHVQGD